MNPRDQLGIAEPAIRVMYDLGERAIVTRLRAAGLLGWRQGRVPLLGRYYARAGLLFRIGQTDYVDMRGQIFTPDGLMPDLWPYHEFVLDQP